MFLVIRELNVFSPSGCALSLEPVYSLGDRWPEEVSFAVGGLLVFGSMGRWSGKFLRLKVGGILMLWNSRSCVAIKVIPSRHSVTIAFLDGEEFWVT